MEANNIRFTTFDADNDNWDDNWGDGNCAVRRGSGSWFNDCGGENINGQYKGSNYQTNKRIRWGNYHDLTKTRLMIRPAA